MDLPYRPTDQQNTQQTTNADVVVLAEEEKRLLLEWMAPSRPFKKRDKDFFTTITVMAILFIVILLFMREFLVVLVVMAFVFLVYVLATVPPEQIKNELYTTGIKNGSHFYSWADLMYYYFETKYADKMMVVRTRAALPGAVYMLLNGVTPEQVESAIGTRLMFKESTESMWMDRAASWLSNKVPLEKNTTTS